MPDATQKAHIEEARGARAAARSWVESRQRSMPERSKKPRRDDASAFFEAARSVDLVNWLVEHPSEIDQIDWMADKIGDVCADVLKRHPGTHVRFADHFWCDVIASLLEVFDQVIKEFESIPAGVAHLTTRWVAIRTWEVVRDSRDASRGNDPTVRPSTRAFHRESRLARDLTPAMGLSEEILAVAVRDVVTVLLEGAVAGVHLTYDNIVLKLRILGMLLCPDPYAHAKVWDHCVVPLTKLGGVILAKDYLDRFFGLFSTPWRWKP